MSAFERALQEAGDGTFLLALVGEPGVGKTRLLAELVCAAERQGLTTLCGRATEFEQEMPFSAIIDALDDHLEMVAEDVSEKLGAGPTQLLCTVFPGLSRKLTGEPYPDSELTSLARYRLRRTIRQLLDEIAPKAGLLLILDDLHWSDPATLELLEHLVRHPPRGRVLIAFAYRPEQAAPQLAALAESAVAPDRKIQVEPFTEAEAAEFLGRGVSRPRVKSMYEASGGVPLYLEALVRSGHEKAAAAELVPSVPAILLVELDGLPAATLLVAQAAAVVSDEFEPAMAAVAAEVPDKVALKALNETVARGVVRPTTAGRFRFRHPLVRRAAYFSAPPGWRIGAHARIARHLAVVRAPASWRAHHVERSAHFGNETAIATLVEAAREVAGRAPAGAAHWLSSALKLMPSDHGRRMDLLLELATAQSVSGQITEGRETACEVLRLLPPDDVDRRAKAARICAMMERHLGRHYEARALIVDELRAIADTRSVAAVTLRLRLVADSLLRSDFRAAQEVLDLMPDDVDGWPPSLSAAIAAMRPLPALASGRIGDAVRDLETAARHFELARDEHLAEWLEAIAWLCWTETLIGRHQAARRHFERAVAVARATGQDYYLTNLLAGYARSLAMIGRLDEAAIAAEEATEVGPPLGVQQQVFALTQQCLVASWSGDEEAALRFGDQALRAAADSSEWWSAMAKYTHGLALINSGRTEQGTGCLVAACDGFRRPKLDPATLVSCCEVLAQIEAAQGRVDGAITWAERAGRLAHPDLEINTGFARLARAHAVRATDPAKAAALALEAADTFGAVELRIDAGRARLTAGLAYADAGNHVRAREQLHTAAEIFGACGARKLHAQALREQRRIGVRIPTTRGQHRSAGPSGLSKRELEVAVLVAKGYSNQQIAEHLFLSIRTIETHLSHILRKFGVTSRVGIANTLTESDEFAQRDR